MRLRKVYIDNFRNFNDCTIHLEQFSVIIGPNNAGKTNFLAALEKVLSPRSARNVDVDKRDFADPTKPIRIILEFDSLTEDDKAFFFTTKG